MSGDMVDGPPRRPRKLDEPADSEPRMWESKESLQRDGRPHSRESVGEGDGPLLVSRSRSSIGRRARHRSTGGPSDSLDVRCWRDASQCRSAMTSIRGDWRRPHPSSAYDLFSTRTEQQQSEIPRRSAFRNLQCSPPLGLKSDRTSAPAAATPPWVER